MAEECPTIYKTGEEQISELVYTESHLREFLLGCDLKWRFWPHLLEHELNIQELCKGALQALNAPIMERDVYANLLVLVCLLHGIKPNLDTWPIRDETMDAVFRYTKTFNMTNIQDLTKHLFEQMTRGENSLINIVNVCHRISASGHLGFAISVCLAWTITTRINNPYEICSVESYCFYQFKHLNTIAKYYCNHQAAPRKLFIFTRCASFLVQKVLYGNPSVLEMDKFNAFFVYTKEEVLELKMRIKQLSLRSTHLTGSKNYAYLHGRIADIFKNHVMPMLTGKIEQMAAYAAP